MYRLLGIGKNRSFFRKSAPARACQFFRNRHWYRLQHILRDRHRPKFWNRYFYGKSVLTRSIHKKEINTQIIIKNIIYYIGTERTADEE